jgi:hypothetical protein
MSNPVLSQLAAVEDDLSQQVESLEYKLTALQEQREGLRTVISMFQGSGQPSSRKIAASLVASASSASKEAASKEAASKVATKEAVSSSTKDVVSSRKPAASKKTGKKVSRSTGRQSTQSGTVKATGPKATTQKPSADSKANKKLDLQKKKDGRAADWQKHVQADYQEAALPEAVSIVLRSQPSEVFTIADVMSSIFTEDMPRASYLKARNRISNILSAGARDGTWYRGRNGRYSQSENVKKNK